MRKALGKFLVQAFIRANSVSVHIDINCRSYIPYWVIILWADSKEIL